MAGSPARLALLSAFALMNLGGGVDGPDQAYSRTAAAYAPVSPDQKHAPRLVSAKVKIDVLRADLPQPWALEILQDGRMLVTEKAGSLWLYSADLKQRQRLVQVPQVDDRGQGGLLDVAYIASSDPHICLSFSQKRADDKSGTSVACGRFVDGPQPAVQNLRVIWQQMPAWDSAGHYGSRIVPLGADQIFVTTGDRQAKAARPLTQRLDATLGKVVRIHIDGRIAADNPFAKNKNARGEIWSLGHRNIQGAALDSQGRLWTIEHGPMGGDELNRPLAGKNYGWPVISYGREYSGAAIGEGISARAGYEQPIYFWDPVIGPSGMIFYQGKAFADWQGDIITGGLVSQGLVRLKLQNDRVVGEERISLDARVRDVALGPDGFVYAITDAEPAAIIRISPATN